MSQQLRKQITEIINRIYRGGMTTASGGNISVRDEEGRIWTTPGGTDKGLLTPEDIVCVERDGSCENSRGNAPTSEFPSHRAIYRAREDVHAIIHAHPPALVTYSIARTAPPTAVNASVFEICGETGYAPYEISGSEELGKSISDQFRKGHSCVIMENHAAVVGGEDLDQAFQRLETLEQCAEAVIKARRLGNCNLQPDEELKWFRDQAVKRLPETEYGGGYENEPEYRTEICNLVRRACLQRLVSGATGSLSVRAGDDGFLITPDAADRYRMKPEEVVAVENGARERGMFPDRLAPVHRRIYESHPHVSCIAFAQPPNVLAYCLAGRSFDTSTIPESYVFLREIPLLPYSSLGEDGREISARISRDTPLLLIENGGVMVTGRSVSETFHRLEIAEFSARSLIDTNALGREVPLEKERLQELTRKFVR